MRLRMWGIKAEGLERNFDSETNFPAEGGGGLMMIHTWKYYIPHTVVNSLADCLEDLDVDCCGTAVVAVVFVFTVSNDALGSLRCRKSQG